MIAWFWWDWYIGFSGLGNLLEDMVIGLSFGCDYGRITWHVACCDSIELAVHHVMKVKRLAMFVMIHDIDDSPLCEH